MLYQYCGMQREEYMFFGNVSTGFETAKIAHMLYVSSFIGRIIGQINVMCIVYRIYSCAYLQNIRELFPAN